MAGLFAVPSAIVTNRDAPHLQAWLEDVRGRTLELLYRASRDGWKGADFHRTCDNKGATLTIIKDVGGNVSTRAVLAIT